MSIEQRRQERIDIARASLDAERRRLENVRESRKQRAERQASTIESAEGLATLMRQMADQLERDARAAWADAKTLREAVDALEGVRRQTPVTVGASIDANAEKARKAIEADLQRLNALGPELAGLVE